MKKITNPTTNYAEENKTKNDEPDDEDNNDSDAFSIPDTRYEITQMFLFIIPGIVKT